jgi:hypothetical protein
MFVSDAQLFVPSEIRWSPILAVRFSSSRRRKSLSRRLWRDARTLLPIAALVLTFALTVAMSQFATLLVPTGAPPSPIAESAPQTPLAMLH